MTAAAKLLFIYGYQRRITANWIFSQALDF